MMLSKIRLLMVDIGICFSVLPGIRPENLMAWPAASGMTTVSVSLEMMFITGTSAEPPVTFITSIGVSNTPKNAPIVPLKIAAASFPSTALVRIRPVDTGGGRHDRTLIPIMNESTSLLAFCPAKNEVSRKPATVHTMSGVTSKEKPWIVACKSSAMAAFFNSSVLRPSPLIRKIAPTPKYFTVISGFKGPPLTPMDGFSLARRMLTNTARMNHCALANRITARSGDDEPLDVVLRVTLTPLISIL
mmetsp:Transcript_2657/g.4894  ORF Transcript_2657/g.4894 Transcript_2657/m.4894 type:complete len:246 (+) Transcript_2657:517-1254(+)